MFARFLPNLKMAWPAAYAFGGTPPLDMVEVFAINLKQFRCARACYESYRGLLEVGINDVPRVQPASELGR